MLSARRLVPIRVSLDDYRLVANAGLMLSATLPLRLGPTQLVRTHLDLGDAPAGTTPATSS